MSQQDSPFQEPGSGPQPAAPSPGPKTAGPFSARPTGENHLAAQLKAAQRQITNLLILLLVVSGTFSIFLWQQVHHDRLNLDMLAQQERQMAQAQQVIDNYNDQAVPAMSRFFQQLNEYAKSHPDVLPILMKYGLLQEKPEASGAAPKPKP